MRPYHAARFGFHCLGAVLLLLATGCYRESFQGASGSGYRIGITVGPAAAFAALLLTFLGYFWWRRRNKR